MIYTRDTINVCKISLEENVLETQHSKYIQNFATHSEFDWRSPLFTFPHSQPTTIHMTRVICTNGTTRQSDVDLQNGDTFENTKGCEKLAESPKGRSSQSRIISTSVRFNHTSVIRTTWRPRREWARTSIDGLASCRTAPSWIAGLEQEGRRAPVRERERNDGP